MFLGQADDLTPRQFADLTGLPAAEMARILTGGATKAEMEQLRSRRQLGAHASADLRRSAAKAKRLYLAAELQVDLLDQVLVRRMLSKRASLSAIDPSSEMLRRRGFRPISD